MNISRMLGLFIFVSHSHANAQVPIAEPVIHECITAAFVSANSHDDSASGNAKNLDLKGWFEKIRENGLADEASSGAAVLAHYVVTLNTFLRIPTDIKNVKVNGFWAKLFLSAAKREEILNMPLVFNVRTTKVVGEMTSVTIQLWPELTANDPSAQLTFFLINTAEGVRVEDVVVVGASFLKTWTEGLIKYRHHPQELVSGLLQKNLVTIAEIEDFKNIAQ